MPSNIEIIIGELFPQPTTGSRVFVSVYATQNVKGEISVTDEHDQICFTSLFELEKEGDALELDISALPAGEYWVCIDILQKQWKRKMSVL